MYKKIIIKLFINLWRLAYKRFLASQKNANQIMFRIVLIINDNKYKNLIRILSINYRHQSKFQKLFIFVLKP